ncbi:MAG: ComF family protein [Candidatus Schekmanbacteria bacterium]|nr:ComF family protein [Candidatus Schekmanbacteria bacterium]
MKPISSNWHNLLFDLFLPAFCHTCQKGLKAGDGNYFCSGCWAEIVLLDKFCSRCGYPSFKASPPAHCHKCPTEKIGFRYARSVGIYAGIMSQAIHLFKYKNKIGMGSQLAGLLITHYARYWEFWNYDYIVPVPLHPRRLRQREFNQSFILASELGNYFQTPVLADNLQRIKFNRPQVELNQQERLNNLKGGFDLTQPQVIKGKNILLIDDVYTTGATVTECAQIAATAGANVVDIYTLARTL